MHREQVFSYRELLFAGKSFSCEIQLKKIEEKNHGGKMIQFLKHNLVGYPMDKPSAIEPAFEVSSVLILRGKDQ